MRERRTFRGEVLWRLRRQREEAARQAFVAARNRAMAIAGRIDTLRAMLAEHDAAARGALPGGESALTLYRRCARDIRHQIAGQMQRLATAEAVVEQRREALIDAIKP